MPAESAILAHDPDLEALLIAQGLVALPDSDQVKKLLPSIHVAFLRAEGATLVSLCEETLWEDYELIPALRDDFIGTELAALGAKVLRPDGGAVREIRKRASTELSRLRKYGLGAGESSAAPAMNADAPPADFARTITKRYVDALRQWVEPAGLPEPLKRRVIENWYARFSAAFRQELEGTDGLRAMVADSPQPVEDRRFDELQRQSWRLDEVLEKLDKWVQANPASARVSATAAATRLSPSGGGMSRSRRLLVGASATVLIGGLIATAFWIAFGTSPAIESLATRVQVRRLNGLGERISRTAAWLGSEPVPQDVFLREVASLQDAKDVVTPIKPEELDAAFVELQRQRLCYATADGWVFHRQVRDEFRVADAPGSIWWQRALQLMLASAPVTEDDESIETLIRWRLLVPHLIALMESAPDEVLARDAIQSLLATLTRGLNAIRVEPGRRPSLAAVQEEPEALQKRINGFLGTPGKYFEGEFKNLEQKHGRFSKEMAWAHRYQAELMWRNRELKEEQNSWIRAARVFEKLEPRDLHAIAFCYLRLGISRTIAGDKLGAEEAFTEGLELTRQKHGDASPAVGRLERKIARVFIDMGEFDPGWQHHQKAMEALMTAYPQPSPELAELHEEQAELLVNYRQFKKGMEMLRRGIEVWQKVVPATSVSVARAHGRLANMQMLAGESAESELSARTQRELFQKEFAGSSVEARAADMDLAEILLTAGDPVKAAEAAKLMEPHLGLKLDPAIPGTSEAAVVHCLHARALAQLGRASDATALFDRNIRVLLNSQPRPSFRVAGCLADYGRALLEMNRNTEGLKSLGDAELELNALTRIRPRYLRLAAAQIDEIEARVAKARQ